MEVEGGEYYHTELVVFQKPSTTTCQGKELFDLTLVTLTRRLPTTSILVVIGRTCRYQFKCSYLKNQNIFVNFLLNFWNLH